MTTVDKNKPSTTGRTNQLPPNVILDRIAQGDVYNAAKSPAEKKQIASKYGWTHQDSFTRSKIATMFGSKSPYNPHLVCRTPWKILDLISQERKPADLRTKLADLIFYAVQSKTMGQEPSAASVLPDVAFIDRLMPELGKYRRQIEILHAWMREERNEGMDMTGAELDLLREPLPNLRRDVFGVQSEEEQAVEQATEFLREAATPIVVEEDDIEMSLPEQKAFPAQITKQITALTEGISTLHLQQEERISEITQSLIFVLGNVRNVEEAAALLAQTSKEASDAIVALIEDLKK